MTAPAPPVDLFRVDRSGPTRRALGFSAFLVTTGATAVGAAFVTRLPSVVGHVVSFGGGLAVLSGLVLGFGSMIAALSEDAYVALTDTGLVVHAEHRSREIAWDVLAGARAEASRGVVVFELEGGEEVTWFAGPPASQIVSRVLEARRRVLLGLSVGRS